MHFRVKEKISTIRARLTPSASDASRTRRKTDTGFGYLSSIPTLRLGVCINMSISGVFTSCLDETASARANDLNRLIRNDDDGARARRSLPARRR